MKNLFSILFLLSVIASYGQNNSKEVKMAPIKSKTLLADLPSIIVINSKTVAFDTTFSKGFVKCEDIPSELNTLKGCIIRKGSKQYIRLHTVLFDKNHEINKIYRYTALGPDIISKKEILRDTSLLSFYNLTFRNEIKVDTNRGFIIDGKDTLNIVDYWQEEKFIFVNNIKSLYANKTLIYEHN